MYAEKSTHFNTKFSLWNLYIIRLEYLNEHVIGPERKHSRHTCRPFLTYSFKQHSITFWLFILVVLIRIELSPSQAILNFRGYWSFICLVWPFTVLIIFRVTDSGKIFTLPTGFVSSKLQRPHTAFTLNTLLSSRFLLIWHCLYKQIQHVLRKFCKV